jgi:hypothetical protein
MACLTPCPPSLPPSLTPLLLLPIPASCPPDNHCLASPLRVSLLPSFSLLDVPRQQRGNGRLNVL